MMDARKMRGLVLAALLGIFVSGVAFADSSYQESTQLTGGALMDAMKSLSFLSKSMKQAYAPVNTLTMVHGNQKAVVSKESTEITDLDKEEIIHIDNVKKTYSVMTFEQMRQAMQQLPGQIQQATAQAKQQQQNPQQPPPNIKTSFSVDVKNTGASKQVNGLVAQEQVVTLTMTVTNLDAQANGTASPDGQPGQTQAAQPTQPAQPSGQPATTGPNGQPNSASFVVTNDAWIAPDPPQVKEIADFDRRLAEKMMEGVDAQALVNSLKNSNPQLAQMLAGKPGSSEAMAQMAKEMEKLKGTRVLENVSMGTLVPASAMQNSSGGQGSTQAQQQNPGSVAGQVAGDTAAQTAAGESSRYGGIAGSALGSSIMGAWHHKKANQNNNSNTNTNTSTNTSTNTNSNRNSNSSTNANAAPAPGSAGAATNAAPTNGAAPANGSTQGMQTMVLMSMTSQKSNFSAEPVPSSLFAIPAGYTQVTPAMLGPAAPTGVGAVSH